MKLICSISLLGLFCITVGCGGCGGEKGLVKENDTLAQNQQIPKEAPIKHLSDFSLKSVGSSITIVFPSGKEVKTDDYNPILSQIPKKAIEFEYGEDGYGRKGFNYHYAIIDFTKIDRKTKLKLTANMHFEFPIDVDSLLYADYRFYFPDDTTSVMPDNPEIREQLTMYARCWKGCHQGEQSMEIIIGTIGNLARFDKKGNKLAEFYSDRFGYGEFSNDLKFFGGAVGGYYSDGGGFYRKTRAYIFNLQTKEMVFHKLVNYEEDIQFFYQKEINKWRFQNDVDNHDEHIYIDPNNKYQYKFTLNDNLKIKYLKADSSGYFFNDGSSILFEKDFEKTPLYKISTPYQSPIK